MAINSSERERRSTSSNGLRFGPFFVMAVLALPLSGCPSSGATGSGGGASLDGAFSVWGGSRSSKKRDVVTQKVKTQAESPRVPTRVTTAPTARNDVTNQLKRNNPTRAARLVEPSDYSPPDVSAEQEALQGSEQCPANVVDGFNDESMEAPAPETPEAPAAPANPDVPEIHETHDTPRIAGTFILYGAPSFSNPDSSTWPVMSCTYWFDSMNGEQISGPGGNGCPSVTHFDGVRIQIGDKSIECSDSGTCGVHYDNSNPENPGTFGFTYSFEPL